MDEWIAGWVDECRKSRRLKPGLETETAQKCTFVHFCAHEIGFSGFLLIDMIGFQWRVGEQDPRALRLAVSYAATRSVNEPLIYC